MSDERDERDEHEEPDVLESLRDAWERFKREHAVQLPTAPVAPRDDRPRFKDGRLRDEVAREEEELDFELASDSSPAGAEYCRKNQSRLDRYFLLKTARDKRKFVQAGRTAGGGQKYYEANRARLAAAEKRAAVEREIEKLKDALTHMTATRDEQAE